ncbi:MAG TPA: methylthioribulose 1-phosphate dehydratase [Oscillatoriales cyanobacterium M59_W2019_021]|nr:MAG: methylthioribulose 1-phosphate dehydratase [Cyanobacteria bacterium J055]HIK30317.1 methylthioribulose 1-phosphate dehydratase [Oscillatoriales cyanobacterium M4454_W2019_049]HIK49791.1 methylthioribulose 1-phosphate dehydratase [Oscillatoriales cyanobacterium M59_W2019_021]
MTNTIDLRSELIAAASHFYRQGWMVGTAGNLSARLEDGSFWITASGRSKGRLTPADFVRVDSRGEAIDRGAEDAKPSAETSIHQALYALLPDIRACYHVHSVEANLVSNWAKGDTLPLPPLEMLKGLGIWDENPQCAMPVFANYADVPRIAAEIESRFKTEVPQVPALLIRNHGVTVWANSTDGAFCAIELVEYIFRYLVAERSCQG